jgi:hypothetical protein
MVGGMILRQRVGDEPAERRPTPGAEHRGDEVLVLDGCPVQRPALDPLRIDGSERALEMPSRSEFTTYASARSSSCGAASFMARRRGSAMTRSASARRHR